jgi:hypothetical protein
MPGLLFAAAVLVTAIPLAVDRSGGNGRAFRHLAVVFLALLVGKALFMTRAFTALKTCRVGSGADRFDADGRGCLLEGVRGELASLARPGQTLAVLPEGSLLNVLTGLSRPTPFGTLMPFEAHLYGDDTIRGAFEEHSPDWVVLVHKDTSEYGPRFFGRDYLKGLGTFLTQRYTPVARWGAEPFAGKEFGIKLLKRNE